MFESLSTSSSAATMASRYCSVVFAVIRATSSCPRITVRGVRSSCETSVENCRICSNEKLRRAIIRLKASISRSSSSPAPRTGMCIFRFECVMRWAVSATELTGERARPARNQPSNPLSAMTTGTTLKYCSVNPCKIRRFCATDWPIAR